MKTINKALLDSLSEQAEGNSRLRKNLNLHKSYDEPSQRLLNAMEPDSYIRPHRHLRDPKPECFVGIRGRMALLIFNDNGGIDRVIPFGPFEEVAGADLPPGVWHTVVCLEKGSVFFETKPGPFNPTTRKDMASWAPEEGSFDSESYLASLKSMVLEFEERGFSGWDSASCSV
jgi:cupin fold WbuC family metalloprotein